MKYRLRNNYPLDASCALEAILKDRGVEDVEAFMNPKYDQELDPYDLENITSAAELVLKHLRNDSNILFIVDCDCDGFTSSAILWLYFKNLFPAARLDFTVHEHKAHGLDDKIDWILAQNKYDLVMVPDAGSYDVECHRRLSDEGIDVLCLDHHAQLYDDNGNPIVSDAPTTIIVNNQLSPNYSNKSLCGAGLAYKFCEVLDDILQINQSYKYIDLAALGEIADVMDRTDIETNYIMMNGLRNIRNRGFQVLIEAQSYSLKEKAIYPYRGLTPIDIAFYIAPLINAITRVGTIAEKEAMFYCFIDPDRPLPSTKRGAKPGDVEYAAEQTARVGANAKAKQNRIKEKAIDLIDFKIQKNHLDSNNIIVVEIDESDEIPQEMTGLIAMMVVSKYHKPCMLGRMNYEHNLQGSIRSDNNFAGLPSFKKFLEDSSLMNYVAGHDASAGFSIPDSNISQLLDYSNISLNSSDFENCYLVDYILDADKNNLELLYCLAAHPEYFGNHIDEIKVVIKNISLASIMTMGTNKDSMKISFNGVDYVKFKDVDFIQDVMENRMKKLTVLARPNLNTFMGKTSIQCLISDYEFEDDDSSKYDF